MNQNGKDDDEIKEVAISFFFAAFDITSDILIESIQNKRHEDHESDNSDLDQVL